MTERARQRVMQPKLLGLWENIDVDPRVWGMCSGTSLLQLSVNVCICRLAAQFARPWSSNSDSMQPRPGGRCE